MADDWYDVSSDLSDLHAPPAAGWGRYARRHSSSTAYTGQPDWQPGMVHHTHTPSQQLSQSGLFGEDEGNRVSEITKRHWVNTEERPACINRQCRLKFTLIDRPHHCRKCGEVFCAKCVAFQRKLNNVANLDPEGKSYKVCQACFGEGKDVDVLTRSWTALFRECKRRGHHLQSVKQHGSTSLKQSWRDKMDLSQECRRLKQGFHRSVGSEVKRTLQELKTMIKTPDWQKSSAWLQESMSTKCQGCSEGFGLLSKKYSCKLCGRVLCKACSHRELLVYMPDDVNDNVAAEAELAVIRIVGSPEVEPETSLLLHVCDTCRQYMVDLQVSKATKQLSVQVKVQGPLSKLIEMDDTFRKLRDKVSFQLSKYQDIVESLEDASKKSGDGSNTKVLAKAQSDLSDHFATIVLKIPVVKELLSVAETDTQRTLIRNYLKAYSAYYLDNIFMFRLLKRKLGESAPVEVLEHIQRVVDKNAIVSAQAYIRQLIMESIHLCQKYSLEETVPAMLTPLDSVIEQEACQCLRDNGEDLEAHKQHLKEFLKSQLSEHRLIRPSRQQLDLRGGRHAADILVRRCSEILEQVHVQLRMKAIERSFTNTKAELEQVKVTAQSLRSQQLITK